MDMINKTKNFSKNFLGYKFKKYKIISLAIFALILFALPGCVDNPSTTNGSENIHYTTALELAKDIDIASGNCFKKEYKSYKDGDLIAINDVIDEIKYVGYRDPSYTQVTFRFTQMIGIYFRFEGNITDSFFVNDTIQIMFHIKHVHFNYYNEITDEEKCYDLELPSEGFNQSYCEQHREVIMPSSCIKHR